MSCVHVIYNVHVHCCETYSAYVRAPMLLKGGREGGRRDQERGEEGGGEREDMRGCTCTCTCTITSAGCIHTCTCKLLSQKPDIRIHTHTHTFTHISAQHTHTPCVYYIHVHVHVHTVDVTIADVQHPKSPNKVTILVYTGWNTRCRGRHANTHPTTLHVHYYSKLCAVLWIWWV